MSATNFPRLVFNRGIISPLALARTDLTSRVPVSAEIQTNWMPRYLGSMMLRPGTEFIGSTRSNALAKFLPFVAAEDDTALIELTSGKLRVWVNDALITRVAVTAAIANGTFNTDLASWTDADETGAVSSWLAGGYMQLVGTLYSAAIRYQLVTLGVGDSGKRHAVRIVINRGPVQFRIGSSVGGQQYLEEQTLGTGTHSLTFTPTTDFYVQFSARSEYAVLVDSIAIESAGTLELDTPWTTAYLDLVRKEQSVDVLYVACEGLQQRKLERRSNESWSIVLYQPEDGPFLTENVTPTTITTSDIDGDATLTASEDIFKSTHVGSLIRIRSTGGQEVSVTLTGADQFSDPIRVTGIGGSREFDVVITGTWSATITVQRSIASPGSWEDVRDYTANAVDDINDGFDNQIIYYRIGIKTGNYTSGTANATITYPVGSITGVGRIKSFSSATSVTVSILRPFGNTSASAEWSLGAWSDDAGWPTAVALFDGRLWWAGMDKNWGSVSDAFESFDPDFEGDAAPISRSIGSGPVETIRWILPLQRLILGGQGAEFSIRSSSFDEPLTVTNYTIKPASTQGSANVDAMRVDSDGIFVHRSGARVYRLSFTGENYDYVATDLSILVPELLDVGIYSIGVQRQPDTRIHCVLNDGTVAILIYDRNEEVQCWVLWENANADVIDVVVLPGDVEDQVYYEMKTSTNHYLCKWALESECRGGAINNIADMFVYTAGSVSSVATAHILDGTSVVVWANGVALPGPFTVSGGAVALGASYTNTTVGLGYTAQYKSSKLAHGAELGTALNQRKRVAQVGLIMRDTHYQGISFGPDFTTMDQLPLIHEAATTAANTVHSEFDTDPIEFPGEWSTDPRLCLQAVAPKPCTVLSAVVALDTQEGFEESNKYLQSLLRSGVAT